MNFFEGKISYYHIRWLYENIKYRPIENFFVHSGILDIANDTEYVLQNVKFFKMLINEIDSKALPPEKKFFNQREYKTGDLQRDLKAHLRVQPRDKSILTVLDYEGVLGSTYIRFIVNRLFFRPNKDQDSISRQAVLSEIEEIFYKVNPPDNIDDEIKSLQREYSYKASLVSKLIEQQKKNINQVTIQKETLKGQIQNRIDVIDNETMNAINELDSLFTKELKNKELEIVTMIDEFKDKEMSSLKKIQTYKKTFNEALEGIHSQVKSLKPISEFEVNDISKKLEMIKVVLEGEVTTKQDFEIMYRNYREVFDRVSILLTSFKEISTDFKGIDIESVNSSLSYMESHLSTNFSKYIALLDHIHENINTNVRSLNIKMTKMDSQLRTSTGNFLVLNKTINKIKEDS